MCVCVSVYRKNTGRKGKYIVRWKTVKSLVYQAKEFKFYPE